MYYQTSRFLSFVSIFAFLPVSTISLDFLANQHKPQRFLLTDSSANFSCDTDTNINDCQYKIWSGDKNREVDHSFDNVTLHHSWIMDKKVVFRANVSMDLSRGRCGMHLESQKDVGRFMIGCRVLTSRKGWFYRYSSLYVGSVEGTELTISPDEAVYALPGENVTLSCMTTSSNRCNFYYETRLTDWSNDTTGVCHAHIRPEINSVLAWCRVNTSGSEVSNSIAISVAIYSAPKNPPKVSLSRLSYHVGDVLEVTCKVEKSRPPANMTWAMKEVAISEDDVEEVPVDTWRLPWHPQARTQILRKTLRAQDHGKNVYCIVEHAALTTPLFNHVTIIITNSSTPASSTTPAPREPLLSEIGISLVVNAIQAGVIIVLLCLLICCIRRSKSCCVSGKKEAAPQDDEDIYDDVGAFNMRSSTDDDIYDDVQIRH